MDRLSTPPEDCRTSRGAVTLAILVVIAVAAMMLVMPAAFITALDRPAAACGAARP